MTLRRMLTSLTSHRDWDAALFFFVMLVGSAAAGESFRRLNGSAISARLGGKEITDEVHWSYRLERDGRLLSFSMGRAGTGTWAVEANELCLDRPVDGRRCFEVWVAGSRVVQAIPAPQRGSLPHLPCLSR